MGFLEQAAAALSNRDRAAGAEEACHLMTRSRALLRLIRGAIGDRIYLFEDSQLRQALRLIAPARDDAARPAALAGLVARFADRLSGFDSARLLRAGSPATDAQMAGVLELLTAARVRYGSFRTEAFEDSFATIEPGLRMTYAKGQLRMGEAFRRFSDLSFARWGTQVSYLRDQATMLDPDWATLGLSERLRKLAASLEEARRLTMLAASLEENGPDEDEEDRELLRLLILGRCRDLYRRLPPIGERLFGEEPAEFTASFGAYWTGWRSR